MNLTCEDRFEILDLLSRYCHCLDCGDVQGWCDTFAHDGTFDGAYGRITGRQSLERFAETHRQSPDFARVRGCQHWMGNILITSAGDGSATASSYGQLRRAGSTSDQPEGLWIYHDVLERIDGGWRFRERVVRPFAV